MHRWPFPPYSISGASSCPSLNIVSLNMGSFDFRIRSFVELFRKPQLRAPLNPLSTLVAAIVMPSRIMVVVGVIRPISASLGKISCTVGLEKPISSKLVMVTDSPDATLRNLSSPMVFCSPVDWNLTLVPNRNSTPFGFSWLSSAPITTAPINFLISLSGSILAIFIPPNEKARFCRGSAWVQLGAALELLPIIHQVAGRWKA